MNGAPEELLILRGRSHVTERAALVVVEEVSNGLAAGV